MLCFWCTCAQLYIYLWARQNKKTDDSFVALQSIANELANGEMPPQEFIYTEALLSNVKWMEGLLEIEKNWEMLISQDCANIPLYNIVCTREKSSQLLAHKLAFTLFKRSNPCRLLIGKKTMPRRNYKPVSKSPILIWVISASLMYL